MNNKKFSILSILIFTILLLYLSFLSIDFQIIGIPSLYNGNMLSNIIKYSSIILCFITSLYIGNDKTTSFDKYFLQLGLFFTVLADTCLVIFNKNMLGVTFFCFVQICYIIRLNESNYKYFLGNLFYFLILIASISFILLCIHVKIKFLYAISIFYGACICTTASSAIKSFNRYPYPNNYCILIGMFLFLLCDINVALYNLSLEITSYNLITLTNISGNLIWLFYLPSQLLLTLSGFNFKLMHKKIEPS